MTEYEFKKLRLKMNEVIWLHTNQGISKNGSYQGNYDNSAMAFDFQNFSNGGHEKISLDEVNSIFKTVV